MNIPVQCLGSQESDIPGLQQAAVSDIRGVTWRNYGYVFEPGKET
jgi:hypothetical protein